MEKSDLAKKIFHICSLKGKFQLRSGKISNEYFDKYLFEAQPDLLKAIGQEMKSLIPESTGFLAGLEMGGIPVAVSIGFETALPVLFIRKRAKAYGTCKLAEGPDFKGKEVTVIEDVVTTGGAIIDGVKALRDQGALIKNVLCVIDRESGGSDNLKSHGITLKSLFKSSELKKAAGVSF